MKATAIAHPNVAVVKYWGKRDNVNFLPMNNSISLTVDSLYCKVTVEFSENYDKDFATVNGGAPEQKVMERVLPHLNRIRKLAGIDLCARGAVETNFPIGVGLASSSAGFAALTAAACAAAGLKLNAKELSIISRQGSGSSCRSIYGGWAEWLAGTHSEDSYAVQLARENHWDIRLITAVVSKAARKVDTRGGMEIAKNTSPLYEARLKAVERDLPLVRKAIKDKDFDALGKIAEHEAMLLHATAITSTPPLVYWVPETVRIMQEVLALRSGGLETYFTFDTGANIHLICLPENEKEITLRLKEMPGVLQIHINKPGEGVKLVKEHLF
ncbi:MAG: diphosphomevalonate decarboxylase [Candidatus Aenigmarchaeota archaeon]|nr:diphosphomevalonate decarboxylase [Candidatus Aenigmarchaeota archaeon]